MNKAQTRKRPPNPDPRPRTSASRLPSPKCYRRVAKDAQRQHRRWVAQQQRRALIEHWKWFQAALTQWQRDGCRGNPPSQEWSQSVLTWLGKSKRLSGNRVRTVPPQLR